MPAPLPGESHSIPIAGSTVNIKALTDQSNKAYLNGREVPVQKDGSIVEQIIVPIGKTEITLEVVDPAGRRNHYSKVINAAQEHFFLAGIVDGSLNYSDADSGLDIRRDNASYHRRVDANGKVSYYLAGKVQGKVLIKSTLDTDKATQKKLFTNIDPDKYYPVYGDNSTVVYDSNSQGKFYLLIEWDKCGFTVGNYQTRL